MTRFLITLAVAGALALAVVAGFAGRAAPARAADQVNECPAPIDGDPWLRVAIGDPQLRLADRDGDGFACTLALTVSGRTLLTIDADNSIGDPNIVPPGPCTSPFVRVGIGDPNILTRQLDANADGVVCAFADPRARTVVVLDNPNVISR